MSLPSAVQTGLLRGVQEPRVECCPAYLTSTGEEAFELCALAGLHLDPWQAMVLDRSLGERQDNKWAAFEVGLVIPRQSGKGSVLEARELAGLFLLGERLIIHSAHQFDTSIEHFRRLLHLIEDTPALEERVARVSRSHGEEGIELKPDPATGRAQRIRFRTRTKGGGRGFTADLLVLDEAMILPEAMMGALLPTLSARPNPQVWYAGSAVDQEVHEEGVVLARLRERALKGGDPSLAYFEWSAAFDQPDDVKPDDATSEDVWAQANPGLNIRISSEHVGREQASMDPRTFAVERLGVGDWPPTDVRAGRPIDPTVWRALADEASEAIDPVYFAVDVSPDRFASIAVAGRRRDKFRHVELVDHKRGTGWVAERVAGLVGKHRTAAVVVDAVGPASTLIPEITDALKSAGLLSKLKERELTVTSTREHAQACGLFVDLIEQQGLRHMGQGPLDRAVDGAVKRSVGDSWLWSRKDSLVDISPLVAVTLALWGVQTIKPPARGTIY